MSTGFHSVAGGNALSLLQAEEVELLVRGSPGALNLEDLRSVCKYDGFPAAKNDPLSDPVVANFWEVFAQFSPAKQRALLSFVTGSNRVPATGIADLKFKITIDEYSSPTTLPVSHTCFSQIVLARYPSIGELERVLVYSMEEGGNGFSIA